MAAPLRTSSSIARPLLGPPPGGRRQLWPFLPPTTTRDLIRPPPRRLLHLAPPFLLDGYTPRYQLLSDAQVTQKRELALSHLRECNLCPRLCGVNRFETTGMCLIGQDVKVNTIAPHFGEGELRETI